MPAKESCMTENRYIIIGSSACSFCIHAADFCIAKHLEYIFLDYEEESEILEEKKAFYKQKTIPIILANNIETGYTKNIGGYSDLLKYEKESR
jgi:glutaredoxin